MTETNPRIGQATGTDAVGLGNPESGKACLQAAVAQQREFDAGGGRQWLPEQFVDPGPDLGRHGVTGNPLPGRRHSDAFAGQVRDLVEATIGREGGAAGHEDRGRGSGQQQEQASRSTLPMKAATCS